MDELYKTLGEAKCRELDQRSNTLWQMLNLSRQTRKSAQVGGTVLEGVAKDFIREFLPSGFSIKGGLVFDTESKKTSPQCDAIIYKGVPLLEFTDVVVVESQQVKAIFEIKAWIGPTSIFGAKSQGVRNPNSGLAYDFKQKKDFLPAEAKYILFAFHLGSSSSDTEIIERLKEICGSHAIVVRWTPKKGQKEGEKPQNYDFDNSVSR